MPERIASQARIALSEETGEAMRIQGRVKTADGIPASGIIVYAYHTDAKGYYPEAATRHGRLRAWVRTDEKGYYRFDTVRPAPYPERDTPAHVHIHIIEPGKATYYIDDIVFDDDELLTKQARRKLQQARGGSGLTYPEKDAQGVWLIQRDIVLGLHIPGYQMNVIEWQAV